MSAFTPEQERLIFVHWLEACVQGHVRYGGDITVSRDTPLNVINRQAMGKDAKKVFQALIAQLSHPSGPALSPLVEAENRLKSFFPKVDRFFVFDVGSVDPADVTRRVCEAFAPSIMNENSICPNGLESLGIGSGQTIYELTRAFSKYKNLHQKFKDTTLHSLTGSIFKPHQKMNARELLELGGVFDADLIAEVFLDAIGGSGKLEPIKRPIIKERINQGLEPNWLERAEKAMAVNAFALEADASITRDKLDRFEKNIAEKIPSQSWVGAGEFFGTHKLHEFARKQLKVEGVEHVSTLGPMQDDLAKLADIVDVLRDITSGSNAPSFGGDEPLFSGVADCCNRLMVLDAPSDYKDNFWVDRYLREARVSIESINEKLSTVKKTILRLAPIVMVVTGKNKAHAARTMLARKIFKFNAVCLDSEIASSILRDVEVEAPGARPKARQSPIAGKTG